MKFILIGSGFVQLSDEWIEESRPDINCRIPELLKSPIVEIAQGIRRKIEEKSKNDRRMIEERSKSNRIITVEIVSMLLRATEENLVIYWILTP